MCLRERERVAVATGEQPVLAALAAAPHRPHGVDHVTRRQREAGGDLCLSGVAAAEPRASRAKLRPRGAVDGAVDAAAAEQRLVRRVDDGVDVKPSDVAFDDVDAAGHPSIGCPYGPRIKYRATRRYWAGGALGGAAEAEGLLPAEEGFTDLIQAMIFHRSSSDFTTVPIGGIGPTTLSEPLRL